MQNYVIGEIAGMRTAIGAMVDGLKSYHWDPAQGAEKVVGEHKQETTQSESKDESKEDVTGKEPKSEGKTSTKKSSSTSLKTSPASGIADYREYVVAIDVKQYHNTFAQLTDIRHAYIKAHVLFARNMKRLSDPRGEGADGSSRNVMSMF